MCREYIDPTPFFFCLLFINADLYLAIWNAWNNLRIFAWLLFDKLIEKTRSNSIETVKKIIRDIVYGYSRCNTPDL
jgi:hypothetical protein